MRHDAVRDVVLSTATRALIVKLMRRRSHRAERLTPRAISVHFNACFLAHINEFALATCAWPFGWRRVCVPRNRR